MVNKREKISTLYIISISDKRLSSFFISFILFHSFYSFLLFFRHPLRFNFVESERNVHSFLCRLTWTFFSLLDVSEQNLFSGGGCKCTQCTPCVAPGRSLSLARIEKKGSRVPA